MRRSRPGEWSFAIGARMPHYRDDVGAIPLAREWEPRIDVLEAESHVLIRVEIPGVGARDVTLAYREDPPVLVVRGNRPDDLHLQADRYVSHVLEIEDGPFAREIDLPEGDYAFSGVRASFKHGILNVVVPKVPRSSGRAGMDEPAVIVVERTILRPEA